MLFSFRDRAWVALGSVLSTGTVCILWVGVLRVVETLCVNALGRMMVSSEEEPRLTCALEESAFELLTRSEYLGLCRKRPVETANRPVLSDSQVADDEDYASPLAPRRLEFPS